MKKKAIEEVPYLKLKKLSGKKMTMYVGVTAIKLIGHERHLFLEVYRNKKESKEIPVIRYVATKKDWGIYDPETGTWSRKRIESYDWGDGLCWYDGRQEPGRGYKQKRECNMLYSPEDLTRIKNFFKSIKIYDDADWWKYFTFHENNLKIEATRRKYRRRSERLNERIENTPELDEKKILDYANRVLFHNKHYLYYKKHGRRATICCSACGGVDEGPYKPGESYESSFERLIEEPREKHIGTCRLCGKLGEYKCQGKSNRDYRKSMHLFLIDKYKETGAVVRYIEVGKEWELEEICGEKGPEMHGAYEILDGIEIARTYFLEDGKIQTDFKKHDPWRNEDFWDDCNLYGLNNISIKEAPVLPESWKNIKGTCLQYSAAEEYVAAVKKNINLNEYMKRYKQIPQLEMIVKLKLYGVADSMIRCECGIIEDSKAERPDAFLGIRKNDLGLLMEKEGNADILRVLQIEKRMNQQWTKEQIEHLAEIKADRENLEMALQIMTVQKLLNNIEKYAGCKYDSNCSRAVSRIQHIATTYFDYLSMRVELGYNMQNTIYQKPRNLEDAHQKMVFEKNKEKLEGRMKEVEEKYPDIRRHYRKLRKRYFYEDDNLVIRPAKSASEIVQEGSTLHHCVGGDTYLNKHNKGESIILMLRFKKSINIPYITVEIIDTTIRQWYGAYDKKPDEKNMKEWLDDYIKHLRNETSDAAVETITQIAG